jgi:hypothetical protein
VKVLYAREWRAYVCQTVFALIDGPQEDFTSMPTISLHTMSVVALTVINIVRPHRPCFNGIEAT